MPSKEGLFRQFITGQGPIGRIISGIGQTLFGLAIIFFSEVFYYMSTHPMDRPPELRSIHPPSRQLSEKQYRHINHIMNLAGSATLAFGLWKLVIAIKQRNN